MKTPLLAALSLLALPPYIGAAPAADAPEKQTVTYKQAGPLAIKADVYSYRDTKIRPVVVWLHGGDHPLLHR